MYIFNDTNVKTESWVANGAVLEWGITGKASTSVPLVLQEIQLGYEQPSTMIYPIAQSSTDKIRINIKGAPSGKLKTTGIFCPTGMSGLKAFIDAVQKECKTDADQVDVILSPFGAQKCGGIPKTAYKFTLHGVELTGIGLDIRGEEVSIIQMPLAFVFTAMEWEL